MNSDTLAMLFQHIASLRFRADAALPQGCVAQHVPDRHPGRSQTAKESDPDQDRCVVVPLARLVPVRIGQQPDPLIVTDGMGRQSRTLCQFTDLHEHLVLATTQRQIRVRAHSKSRTFFYEKRRSGRCPAGRAFGFA